jgi:hypothetical protein
MNGVSSASHRLQKLKFCGGTLTKMQQLNDPRKRPLLTPQQLRLIQQAPRLTHQPMPVKAKISPREEFENLFRCSAPGVDPASA